MIHGLDDNSKMLFDFECPANETRHFLLGDY